MTVNYGTTNGTATANNDYQQSTGSLSFAPGQVVKTVQVPIVDSGTIGPNTDFFLNLSGATNATIVSSAGQGTATIIDNPVTGPRTLVWTGTSDNNLSNPANWDDVTNEVDPAITAPDASDSTIFNAGNSGVTGNLAVQALTLSGNDALSLESGTDLTATAVTTVGDTAAADLIVEEGALLAGSSAMIGNTAGASGSSVTVDGLTSDWRVGGTLVVGNAASGALSIDGGGTVTAAALNAAAQAGGDGVIALTGTGSSLSLSGSLTVGDHGAGELSILGGATVSALDVTIGNADALSSGNVDLEGSGSTLRVSAGGLLNIGVAGGGSGVLTVGSGAVLNFAGTIVESGHASFNNNGGVVDPDAIEFTTASNSGAGINDYNVDVGNIGAVQINSGTGTWTTPMILTGTSAADASNNINNGDVGEWQLNQGGTLIINTNTVDAGQAIVFEDATDTLVIGQVVNDGSAGISGVLPTIAAGAENLLAAGDFAAQIWGYQAGDQIQFDNLTVTSDSIVGGNTLDIFGAGDVLLGSLTFYNKAGTKPLGTSGMDAAAEQVICFCKGTLITTLDGEVPVEKLQPGDHVLTLRGEARRIIWIGTGRVMVTRGRRSAATPVIVRKSAIADNVPHRDLHMTKGHSLFFDDVLVPVEFLVNHRTILWDDLAQEVTIYHIELETHDVLLANGAPAESYRDDGNRWLFQNANSGWGLPPQEPCAPVLTGGPKVDTLWRRLLDRAGPRKGAPLTDDPDLYLLVDGKRVDPIERSGGMQVFCLPTRPHSVRICSRAAAPQELGLARDPRQLGVAVRKIVLAERGWKSTLEADAASLADGYHGFEADSGIRWTDGNAAAPTELFAGMNGPSLLMLHLGGSTQYFDEGTAVRAA